MEELPNLITVTMFGELRIRVNNLPIQRIPAKSRELFAMLVLWNDHPVPRKQLANILWPDSPTANALGLLRTCLLELRKALGPAASRLKTEGRTTLQLELEDATVDVYEFDIAVKHPGPAARDMAIALYTNDLLPGWDAAWLRPERERRARVHARLLKMDAEMLDAPYSEESDAPLPAYSPPVLQSPDALLAAVLDLRGAIDQSISQIQFAAAQLDLLSGQLANRSVEEPALSALKLATAAPLPTVAADAGQTISIEALIPNRAKGLYTLSVSQHLSGDIEEARVGFLQALKLTALNGDDILRALVLNQLGQLETYRNVGAAADYFDQAYQLRIELLGNLQSAIVSSLLGMGETAPTVDLQMEYLKQALKLAESIHDVTGTAWAHSAIAVALVEKATPDDLTTTLVANHYEQSLIGFSKTHDVTGMFSVMSGLALMLKKLGLIRESARMVEIEAITRAEYASPRAPYTQTTVYPRWEVLPDLDHYGNSSATISWEQMLAEITVVIRQLIEIPTHRPAESKPIESGDTVETGKIA